MEKFILTKTNLLQAQVCTEESWDDALDWLQLTNPSGTRANWMKDERECVAPVQCSADRRRKHYVFDC